MIKKINDFLDKHFPTERPYLCTQHTIILSNLNESQERRFITFNYRGHVGVPKVGLFPICSHVSKSRNEMRWIEAHPDFKSGKVFHRLPKEITSWCTKCHAFNGHMKGCSRGAKKPSRWQALKEWIDDLIHPKKELAIGKDEQKCLNCKGQGFILSRSCKCEYCQGAGVVKKIVETPEDKIDTNALFQKIAEHIKNAKNS